MHCVSILGQTLYMVPSRLENLVIHQCHDVWSPHEAVWESVLGLSTVLIEITQADLIATRSCIESPCVWYSVSLLLDNLCKCLLLLIQYPELLSHYCMDCCCKIKASPAHFGCCYEYRVISLILEFELHFCAFIIAHFCIHVEYMHMIHKILG